MKRLNERFTDAADWVSNAMGTPANIVLWLVLVAAWFLAFATHPNLQNSSFLPSWFTSNSFNFPLNSITTLAELYIGFLVAAAANRVERRNHELAEKQAALLEKIVSLEDVLDTHVNVTAKQHSDQLAENTTLTQQILQKLQDLRANSSSTP